LYTGAKKIPTAFSLLDSGITFQLTSVYILDSSMKLKKIPGLNQKEAAFSDSLLRLTF